MHRLLIVCADVGSIKNGNFGWADSDGAKGVKPSSLAAKVSAALYESRPVALGFECPLYLPLPGEELNLGRSRDGEGSRPWSAGAGCASLATGLVQAAWILREIRKLSVCTVGAHLNWDNFESAGSGLLLWEAFVSRAGKGSGHIDDAALAVKAFKAKLPRPKTDLQAPNPLSLAGCALLWSGWLISSEALRQPCIAIKA